MSGPQGDRPDGLGVARAVLGVPEDQAASRRRVVQRDDRRVDDAVRRVVVVVVEVQFAAGPVDEDGRRTDAAGGASSQTEGTLVDDEVAGEVRGAVARIGEGACAGLGESPGAEEDAGESQAVCDLVDRQVVDVQINAPDHEVRGRAAAGQAADRLVSQERDPVVLVVAQHDGGGVADRIAAGHLEETRQDVDRPGEGVAGVGEAQGA